MYMNNGDDLNSHTIFTLISITGLFVSLYFLYDRVPMVKRIGDMVLAISPGNPKKERFLFLAVPPLVILSFGLLFKYWDKISRVWP